MRHIKANHFSQNVGVRVEQHVIDDLPNVDENSQQHVADMRQIEREKIQQQTIVLKPNHSAQNFSERVQHVIEDLPNVDDNSQHVVDVQNERKKMRQQKKVFECSLCEATFSRRNILSSHFNARHNDCKLKCNKTFTYKYKLLRHKHEKHLVKEHVVLAKEVGLVEDVAKEVKEEVALAKELDLVKDVILHKEVDLVEEVVLAKEVDLVEKEELAKEEEKHHPLHVQKVKKVFECGLCGYIFSRKSVLGYHYNAQHKCNMHQCNLCDKSFRYSRNLVRHKKYNHKHVDRTQNVGENMT